MRVKQVPSGTSDAIPTSSLIVVFVLVFIFVFVFVFNVFLVDPAPSKTAVLVVLK